MSLSSKVSIILPVYNSSEFIEASISRLKNFCQQNFSDFQIIVVNDGSEDNSRELLERLKSKIDFKLFTYPVNRGKGYAVKCVIASGDIGYDNVIIIDSDLPQALNLQQMVLTLKSLEEYDVVVMSRYHKDSKVLRKGHRKFLSAAHRMLVRLILPKVQSTDVDVGFKGFKRSFLENCLEYTSLNRWSWDLQALSFAFYNNYKVIDLPLQWEENYQQTTVRWVTDSIDEFCGIFYIRWQIWAQRI